MRSVFITSCGAYLPGESISNDEMENFLGLVDGRPSRIKHKILASNGIKARHYAIDREGRTTELNEQLAAHAVERALLARDMSLSQVEMLALGTTLPDVLIPSFASMVQGRLGAPAMEVLSAAGTCCSGLVAMQAAYRALRSDTRRVAVAGGSELASRILRGSRFDSGVSRSQGRGPDLGSEFMRWMLSDGAGVVVLEQAPRPKGLSLRIDWMDLVSHSGEALPCMYFGVADPRQLAPGETWLDQPTYASAERRGMLLIRQDIQMLDRVVELAVEHWLRLMRAGKIVPSALDYVLCHYSSELLRERFFKALMGAEIFPSKSKWFSNLSTKGNTGAAAIFIALEDLFTSGALREGQNILLAVPESARYATCIAHLTVVSASSASSPDEQTPTAHTPIAMHSRTLRGAAIGAADSAFDARSETDEIESPLSAANTVECSPMLGRLLGELAFVWAHFNALLRQVPMVQRVDRGVASIDDYRRLIRHLRQQVVDGSCWMARAASNTSPSLAWLRSMLIQHAAEEHRDYELLEQDYVALGGTLEDIRSAPKNPGSEALSAFVFHRASLPDPVDLVGVMFVIEGLGVRVAGRLVQRLRDALALRDDQTSFLRYHANRDQGHMGELEQVLGRLELDEPLCERIVRTAKVAARLYVLQLEEMEFD